MCWQHRRLHPLEHPRAYGLGHPHDGGGWSPSASRAQARRLPANGRRSCGCGSGCCVRADCEAGNLGWGQRDPGGGGAHGQDAPLPHIRWQGNRSGDRIRRTRNKTHRYHKLHRCVCVRASVRREAGGVRREAGGDHGCERVCGKVRVGCRRAPAHERVTFPLGLTGQGCGVATCGVCRACAGGVASTRAGVG